MNRASIAFVRARWHFDIVDRALEGFLVEIERLNVDADVTSYQVPGAFELPLLARRLAATKRFDAIVCAALVVDGGIYRHEFVAQAVVSGLMEVQLRMDVPTFSLCLTPHNFQPTEEHRRFFKDHFVIKGQEAARAVQATLDVSI